MSLSCSSQEGEALCECKLNLDSSSSSSSGSGTGAYLRGLVVIGAVRYDEYAVDEYDEEEEA